MCARRVLRFRALGLLGAPTAQENADVSLTLPAGCDHILAVFF